MTQGVFLLEEKRLYYQITTTYDRETMLALQRVAGKTTRKWPTRLHRGIEFLFAAVLLGEGTILLWLRGPVYLIVLALLLGCLTLYMGVFYYRIGARQSQKLMVEGAAVQEITLTGEELVSHSAVEESHISYGVVRTLYYYGHYYFLFLDKKHSVILDERGIREGDPAGLAAFLEQKCGTALEVIR